MTRTKLKSLVDKLNAVKEIPTWTRTKHEKYNQIESELNKSGHFFFYADERTYKLPGRGNYKIFKVKEDQKGALKIFRGKEIMLISTGPNTYKSRYGGFNGNAYFAIPIHK